MINKCEIGHRALIAASWQLTSLLEKLWVVVGEGQVLLTGYQVKAFFFLGVWPHLARQQGQLHRGPVYLCEVGVEDIHVTLWASQALRPLLPNLLMGTVILYQFMSPHPQHLKDVEHEPRLGWKLWVLSFPSQGVSSNMDLGLGASLRGRA